ncbi:regulatory LuxR family protein [Halopolyspora algeriensis]|uniref:Regulatory LuxR family protein n=1 Tax=Halopolyspora algeriensis TaxID=1500506 RepID=A0A368VYQ7_9ACTN|nr:LuxR family transcriptional regulator [Halopolyspora algeriensis]RCW45962.1 regulatory LuxR family protein [Halopolyspora algeriensis]TQM55375.1 regulatory LuxR family protein [Halopolyspora algeriensis]
MVGRQRELSELEHLLTTARGGRSTMVLVEGPAGIGKTTLLEQFLAHQGGVRVFRSSGVSWESSLPFGVVEQLKRGTGEFAASARPCEGEQDPVDAGCHLLDSWSRIQEQEPVVIVVDDAHQADVESLRALSSAFRRMAREKVLIILATREDRQDNSPAEVHEFLSGHRGPTVRVAPLTPAEVQDLAIRWAGVDLSSSTAQRLSDHTRGNPLHVRQLLNEAPSEVWLEWQPMLPAPRQLAATVVRAMHACGPSARALVESAAVLGQTISFTEATALAELEEPVLALDEASKASLLTVGVGRGLTTLTFPSPLVQAAVYADLQPLRRQELHRKAAEITENEGTRLMHRVAAAPFADAGLADELDEFASRQAALGAWSAVGDALISAIRLSPAQADRERRLVRAVDALVGAGELPKAIAFSPAIESFPAGAPRDAVLGYLAILLGRPDEAELLLARAWQQCDPNREPDTAALICQRRVLHSLSRLHGADLVTWARRAVELAVDPQNPSAIESEAIIGLGLAATGRIREAKSAYREVSAKVGAGAQLQRVQMGKGWLDLALDDPQTARRELEGASPTRYRRGSARISLWAQAWLARAEFVLGAWDDAMHTVDRAVTQLEHTGLELVRPLVHWTGAQTHALRGNWEAAHEHLQRASVAAHTYEIMLVPACLARAQYAEARADYETVIRSLEPLLQIQPRQGIDEPGLWPWQDVYANALVMTNRAAEADAFLTPYEALAAERGHRSTLARLGYVRGRIAGTEGDIEAAKGHFGNALAQLTDLPLPYDRARVNFAYGQTLRRAGKRREADVVLRNARDAYATLGARAYVERCDRELKASGLKAQRSGADLTQLTAQEQAVAELVAAGMSNKQAAVELFVSVKTVQFHLTRIYAKLGIGSRGELAARFRTEPGDDRA